MSENSVMETIAVWPPLSCAICWQDFLRHLEARGAKVWDVVKRDQ